jgi:transposase
VGAGIPPSLRLFEDCDDEEIPAMVDGSGLAEAMLGLDGVRVIHVCEADGEVTIEVEMTEPRAWCARCGCGAESQDRMWVDVRDLECFGRPTRLRIWKRRWRCRELLCSARTWTEPLEFLDAQVVLTRRTGAEACRRVGELARAVSQVADEFGVCWETVMNAVVEHGTALVDDPDRVGRVRQLGVDETSFLRANRHHHTIYATGLVDLEGRRLIDLVEGNAAVDRRTWTANADPDWLAGIEVVATDLAQSFRAGLSPHLDHAIRVADPFHVVRVANRCLDDVRRRVQNDTLGHRGRKNDPLYKIGKLLLTGSERLNERGRDRILLSLRNSDPNDDGISVIGRRNCSRQENRNIDFSMRLGRQACSASRTPIIGSNIPTWDGEGAAWAIQNAWTNEVLKVAEIGGTWGAKTVSSSLNYVSVGASAIDALCRWGP